MADVIRNRYDFVILFDVENGNPNGDPDAGNLPRVDPETGCGLVTDVCLKRKIRNYVETVKEDDPRFGIYIKDGVPLNASDKAALESAGHKETDLKALKKTIMPQEVTITRVAITTEEDAAKKGTEMGRKFIVPYGLYRAEGYISANLARKTTGFDEDDVQRLQRMPNPCQLSLDFICADHVTVRPVGKIQLHARAKE